MEYTSPNNRIVVPYKEDCLTVLMIRNNKTGESYFGNKLNLFVLKNNLTGMINNLVEFTSLNHYMIDNNSFIDKIRQQQEGEGYVIEYVKPDNDSYLVKVKNFKYLSLHHTKDSVNSPKRLFEVIINEAVDDLKSLFHDDEVALKIITDMEDKVYPIYNGIIKTVQSYTEDNVHLERKEFAIKCKAEQPELMYLIMNQYLNCKFPDKAKDINYKEFAIKNMKKIFKIDDVEKTIDIE